MSAKQKQTSINIAEETIREIDGLEIPFVQKHHLRLLIHCLEIFKELSQTDSRNLPSMKLINEWCDSQSEQFDDQSFAKLFQEQMNAAFLKIQEYCHKNDKNFKSLDLYDLIEIVKRPA